MKGFGTSSHLKVKDKTYYIETSFLPTQNAVISKVTKEGKIILIKRDEIHTDKIDEKKAFETIKNYHENLLKDLKVWLEIKEKMEEAPLEMYVKLCEKLIKLGLLEEAKELMEEKIKLDENYAPANFVLGKIYFELKDYEKSSLYFDKAIQLKDYPNYLMWGARCYRFKGEYTRSLSYLKKALEKNPSYAEAQFEMGMSLLELSLSGTSVPFKSILLSFKSAEILDPRFKNEIYKKGMEHLEKGEILEAKDKFTEFFNILSPPDVHEILDEFILLSKYGHEENYALTLEDYILKLKEIAEEHPDYADVRFNLAIALLLRIKALFDDAENELKNALSINPDYEEAKKIYELLRNEIQGYLIFIKSIGRQV